ncbi:AI-2E family transporter [Peribacillus sp. SCS-155]|uniref:AI-2E family transporter n=1 Tax=Peribacillus sedimenti TaxID=3115297 RepID=UPI003905B714
MWINKPFFQYASGTLLIILIILLLGKIDYFLWPFQKMIATLFFPIVISGLLYYLLRPLVGLLTRHMPKTVSIGIVYLAISGLVYIAVHFSGQMIGDQLQSISKEFPNKLEEITSESEKAIQQNDFGIINNNEKLKEKALRYFSSLSGKISGNLASVFSTLASIATVLVLVPFLLFYFLKDDDKLRPFLLKYIPREVESEGNVILKDVDKALSTYIIGQVTIAFVDGVLMYLGYLLIGLDYALILALFAMFLTVVPFLGPFLGIIPALFVALQQEPFMLIKVLLVLLAVQQLEGNLVTPHVMGKKLNIHPVTIILLLLVAGALYGFIGILIAIPLYSVVKTLIRNFRLFYRLRQKGQKTINVK